MPELSPVGVSIWRDLSFWLPSAWESRFFAAAEAATVEALLLAAHPGDYTVTAVPGGTTFRNAADVLAALPNRVFQVVARPGEPGFTLIEDTPSRRGAGSQPRRR